MTADRQFMIYLSGQGWTPVTTRRDLTAVATDMAIAACRRAITLPVSVVKPRATNEHSQPAVYATDAIA